MDDGTFYKDERLLDSVQRWFETPDQVKYYAQEVTDGLTPGEQALLEGIRPASTILDVGCGVGRVSIPLMAMNSFSRSPSVNCVWSPLTIREKY